MSNKSVLYTVVLISFNAYVGYNGPIFGPTQGALIINQPVSTMSPKIYKKLDTGQISSMHGS